MVFKLLEFKEEQMKKPVSSIHDAAFYGSLDEFKSYIAHGASLTQREFSWSLMHYAALRETPEFVQKLLDKGAEIDPRDEINMTPLHCAAYVGNLAVIRCLHERGADLNAIDEHGYTPMHLAAFRGRSFAVAMLIALGADSSKRDYQGKTPNDYAAEQGYNAIRMLISEADKLHNKKSSLSPDEFLQMLGTRANLRMPEMMQVNSVSINRMSAEAE